MAMEPGRELDKLVAEAMGLGVYSYDADGYHPYQGNHDWLNNQENYPHITIDKDRLTLWMAPDTDGKEWSPSTDWAAAGQAWEWLEQNHPWSGKDILLVRLDTPLVVAIGYGDAWETICKGDTYPHAIALAVVEAAKAKGTLT